MRATLRYADATLQVATARTLCVARWTHTPLPAQFRQIASAMQLAAADGSASLLNVVENAGHIPRLSLELRRAATRMIDSITPICAGIVHVILIDGLRGSAVRMILSTLALVVRPTVPVSIHGSLRLGAATAAKQGNHGFSAVEIETIYRTIVSASRAEKERAPQS